MDMIISVRKKLKGRGIRMKKINVKEIVKLQSEYSDLISALAENIPDFGSLTPERTEEIINAQRDDFPVFELPSADRKEIVSALRERDGGYVVPSSQRAYRQQTQEIFCRKKWEVELRMEMTKAKYSFENARTLRTFLSFENTPEANMENERFHRVMTSGTPEQKKEEIARRIEAIGEMDFASVDLTDDRAIAENYEKIFRMANMVDAQNVQRAAREVGLDLTEPRFAKYCEKALSANALWQPIGYKFKELVNPLYAHVYAEKVPYSVVTEEDIEVPGFDTLPMDHENLFNKNADETMQVFVDPSLTPAERWEKAQKINLPKAELYRNSLSAAAAEKERFNALSAEEKENYVPPYTPLADTPDGYFAALHKHLSEQTRGGYENYLDTNGKKLSEVVAVYRMQKEYTDLLAAGKAPSGEEFHKRFGTLRFEAEGSACLSGFGFVGVAAGLTEDEYECIAVGDKKVMKDISDRALAAVKNDAALRRENPHDYYRAKILQNIEKIRSFHPGFTMTDEEVEAMITPERIAMHDEAKKVIDGTVSRMNRASYMANGEFDPVFKRIVQFLGKRPEEEGAEEYNRELYAKLIDVSADGEAFRRKTFLDIMNRVNEFSPDDFKGKTEKESFELSLRKYELGRLAFDIKNVADSLSTVGLGLSEEAKARFKGQYEYLTDLGSVAVNNVNKLGDDMLFTMPLHKLNADMLAPMFADRDPVFSQGVTAAFNIVSDEKNYGKMLNAPSKAGVVYREEDVVSVAADDERTVEDCASVRETYAKFYRELRSADHFYNFNNSDEYKKLLTSLEKADKVLAGIGGGYVPEKSLQQLRDAMKDVNDNAKTYSAKKSREAANDIRTRRIGVCNRITTYNKILFSEKEGFNREGLAAADPKFNAFVRTVAQTQMKRNEEIVREHFAEKDTPVDEKTAEREATFNAGLRKTQAEREKIDRMRRSTAGRKAQILAVKARDGLTDLVGRSGIDQNKARLLMATVVCCDSLVKSDRANENLSHEDINALITKVYEDKAFKRLTADITSDKLNEFLTDGASDRLAADYRAAARQRGARENAAPEVNDGVFSPENNAPSLS